MATATVPGLPVYGVDAASLRSALNSIGIDTDATLCPLTGGMSNALFLATSMTTNPPRRHVVRLLNPSLDAIIDRGRELRILLRLGAAGVSPRLVGISRVSSVAVRSEEYLEGRTLVVRDFRSGRVSASHMARAIARMHAELVSEAGTASAAGSDDGSSRAVAGDWLGQRTTTFSDHMVGYLAGIASQTCACSCALVSETELLSQPPLARERLCRLLHSLDWSAEAAFVSSLLAARGGPLVLAHNDLQPGNWIEVGGAADDEPHEVAYARRVGRRLDEAELRSGRALSVHSSLDSSSSPPSRRASPTRGIIVAAPAAGNKAAGSLSAVAASSPTAAAAAPEAPATLAAPTLKIIDLEYAGLNTRAFDLGNLFCEFAMDYSHATWPFFSFDRDAYPVLEAQSAFVCAYALAWREEVSRRPQLAENEEDSSTAARAGVPADVDDSHEALSYAAAVPGDSAAAAERWARTSTSHAAVSALLARGRRNSPTPDGGSPRARADAAALAALERQLAVQARIGMLASHFYWAAWSAVMTAAKLAAAAPSDAAGVEAAFSYSAYGIVRAREYVRLKAQLVADGSGCVGGIGGGSGDASAACD